MINQIKKELLNYKNKNLKIKVDVGRNKYEEYIGKITDLFDRVWLFKTENLNLSFSYNDLIINRVIISLL